MTAADQLAAMSQTASTTLFVSAGVALAIAIILIAAMWRVFVRAGKPGWWAIVPFYNVYVLLKIVGRPAWWLVLLLIPGVNIVFGIIVIVDLAKAYSRGAAEEAREPNYIVLAGVALVVVAAFAAVWFGASWISSANDDTLSRAKTRDEVDRIARSAITTFHTLDYHKVDEGLDGWLNASTGDLHNEVLGRRASAKQTIEEAKTITSANVLSLSVTELNRDEGKATVIAAVRVTVSPEGKQAENKYMRIQGVLERAGDGWKLSGIGQVDFARS